MLQRTVGRPSKAIPGEDLGVGMDARARLLMAGLQQFADLGFAGASTRAIANAAQTNVAMISYHFGDKAGLYKAILSELSTSVGAAFEKLNRSDLDFAAALKEVYLGFMGDLDDDNPMVRLMMKIHMRECADPSEVFKQWVRGTVGPMFLQLEKMLMRELCLERSDIALHRLAFGLIAIANDYWASGPFISELSPGLRNHKRWLAETIDHVCVLGVGMVQAEKQRRVQKRVQA